MLILCYNQAMHEYLIYVIMAPIGACILLFTFGAVLRFRREAVGKTLLLYLSLILAGLVVNLLELFVPTEKGTLFFGKLYFLFSPFVPLVWFYFSLQFTGLLTSSFRKKMAVFLIIPSITAVMVHIPALMKFFYTDVHFLHVAGYVTYKAEYGPWFWVHGVQSYVLLFAGMLVVVRSYVGSRRIFRVQSLFIVIGQILPLIVNFLYVFRVFPGWHKDYTPVAFALTGIFFFVGMYSHRLLHLVPVARNLIIKNLEAGIIVFDNKFRLIDYNLAAEKIFNFNELMLGIAPDELVPLLKVFGISADQLSGDSEGSFIRKNEGQFYNCQIKKIEIGGKHENGIIVSINNVSEHIRLLDERTNTVDQLKHINEELKKTQQHMIHREKLASIGQLSAGIAHELNNPLSYIKSNMNVLDRYRKELFPAVMDKIRNHLSREYQETLSEGLRDIGQIVDSSLEGLERIIEVVKNLLRFARVDDSNLVDDYDLHEGLESAINITASEFRYDAEIIREYGSIPLIECRGSEINQVIINILANAAQAARDAAAHAGTTQKIWIRTSEKNGFVTCVIENSGSEIPADIREKIFEPFYTTKKPGKGTGLGLSIAWDIIVKRHNGSIQVTSEKNRTAFIIELPVKFAFAQL
ncbi:MAG: hypothetical protein JW874_08475 [Spirochaetales bacterium]|nr:hypothetical protein [Spirochaetales bacterium]